MSLLERMLNWGGKPEPVLQRTDDDGTSEDVFQSLVSEFWSGISGVGFSPTLADRVWVASRCIHLNSQQIARMPLRFFGTREPAWVSNPDPSWFPNGIGDAVYAALDCWYRWGDAFLYITSRYADGYPSAWTVLDSSQMNIEIRNGRKMYRLNQRELDPANVVQISRDPRGGLRGTPALRSYSSQAWGLLASSDMGRIMMESGKPSAIIKSNKKMTPEQAQALSDAWAAATAARRGGPAVMGPDLSYEASVGFSAQDLALLETQKFNGQVIASAFGVPAQFVNLPIEGLTYQSAAMLGEHWWRFELRPTATAFSQALGAQMLPAGAYVEFDARDTLAPTFKELVDAWVAMAEAGLVSGEELRAAVLRLPAEQQEQILKALTTPPSAGASPAQQPPGVVELRPTNTVY